MCGNFILIDRKSFNLSKFQVMYIFLDKVLKDKSNLFSLEHDRFVRSRTGISVLDLDNFNNVEMKTILGVKKVIK